MGVGSLEIAVLGEDSRHGDARGRHPGPQADRLLERGTGLGAAAEDQERRRQPVVGLGEVGVAFQGNPVALDGCGVAVVLGQEMGEIRVEPRGARFHRQRPLVGREGRVEPVELLLDAADVIPGQRQGRVEVDGAAIRGQGLFVTAHGRPDIAEIAVGMPQSRGQLDGAPTVRGSLVEPVDIAELHQHVAQVGMAPGVLRLAFQHLVIHRGRLVEAPERLERLAAVDLRGGEARPQADRLVKRREGPIGLAVAQADQTEVVVGRDQTRVELEGRSQHPGRLDVLPQLPQHLAARGVVRGNLGSSPDRLFDPREGLELSPLLAERDAEQVQGVGLIGLGDEQGPVPVLGRIEPAGAMMGHRFVEQGAHE